MFYTVEELRNDWHVVACLEAVTGYQAVSNAQDRPGMYRTAAPIEPERRYFWQPPDGKPLEAMDRPGEPMHLGNRNEGRNLVRS
jgi:hypothetical protein